jgi:Pyruvate/2-oxoacid:ferredoxin oxidoreductase delta subunit
MEADELREDKDLCYGCGLCLDVCPENCVQMISR